MKDASDNKKIIKYLKKNINPDRLEHVIGTAECAVKMAKAYGTDSDKAEKAALLHDCAKEESDKKLIKRAKDYGFEIDEMYTRIPQLLHGAAGALIAKTKFGIEDPDILEAVCYHTVPKPTCAIWRRLFTLQTKLRRPAFLTMWPRYVSQWGRNLWISFLYDIKKGEACAYIEKQASAPASLETYNHILSTLYKTH